MLYTLCYRTECRSVLEQAQVLNLNSRCVVPTDIPVTLCVLNAKQSNVVEHSGGIKNMHYILHLVELPA